MDADDNISNLRVASFSCYLNKEDQENFMLKLAGAIQDSVPAVISPQENLCPVKLGKTKNNEGEISVFGANKYFDMKMDYESRTTCGHMKEGYVDLHRVKPNFRPGTPSVCSEASTWKSQTALLQNFGRTPSQIKQKRALGKRFFVSFGCNGPCSDKKAVHINEGTVEHGVVHGIKQSQSLGLKRGEQFAFPILKPGMENPTTKKQFEEEKVADEPRNSLEVFGSDVTKKGDIATNLERKLSILTWDAIPKAPNIITTTFGSNTMCDDMASDASSDLFEIENISGAGYSLLTRQASDNMSSCMTPTTQYAPSEASIEWSVITASAADFSSVVSDYDEKNINTAGIMISTSATTKTADTKNVVGKEAQKGHPSRLLGCRSYKAVRVAESAYRPSEKAKREGSDSSMSFGYSQAETRGKYNESLKHSFASRGLSP